MKSGTEENTMDFGNMMKLMGAWNTFKRNHPKFPKFLQAASTAVKEDTLIEIKITTAEGKVIETNLKVKASDIELFKNLTM
jgi:hypothetical protein